MAAGLLEQTDSPDRQDQKRAHDSGAIAHVSCSRHRVVTAAIRQALDQPDRKDAGVIWRKVAGQLRPRWIRLADLVDASAHDVLACIRLRPFLPRADGCMASFTRIVDCRSRGFPCGMPERGGCGRPAIWA
jgi:hypothetical protein